MTVAEHIALDDLAKAVSYPHIPCAAVLPLYADALDLLVRAWAPDLLCRMCPRRGTNHTCGCPHAQARKHARWWGAWPLDRAHAD